MNNKKVIITPIPLPYHQIGSWTQRYGNLITSEINPFDYVICPPIDSSQIKSNFTNYRFAEKIKYEKITKKIFKYTYYHFLKQLQKILNEEKKLILFIIDNVKLLHEVHDFLEKKKLRNKCRINFNICGFSYYFNSTEGQIFYDKIDHVIFPTYESYQFELNRYSYLANKVSILPNGVDSSRFYKVDEFEKSKLKKEIGYENKTICLWLSQNRPKKGLPIFLEAWKNSNLYQNSNYVLLIIGYSNDTTQDENIYYLNKIPNYQLPKFYHISDFYFFTTLFHEGFGLSLVEAIKTGCTCFASNLPPMTEVTQNQNLAYLVNNPNLPYSWTNILNNIFENKIEKINHSKEFLNTIYSIEDWNKNIIHLINQEKSKQF